VNKVVSHVPGGSEMAAPGPIETAIRQPTEDEARLKVVG
jgi:hypothetical protein